MSQLLHLSASGVFSPLARRPAGYPNKIAGQPCVYLKKDLTHSGHYTHPAKGFNVPVDRKRIDDWVSNFRKMRANGVKVPINLDHSDRAADCVGHVVEMSRSGDALNAVCQFIGADAAELAARNYVSVGIDPAYTDGQERDYGDAIVHVALTPVPIVPDQAPFALAATASPAVSVAPADETNASENKPIPMYKLTCHESTLRGLYRLVPGMEQAPHDQKIACLCRHLQMIARLDEKYGLAPSRLDLWNFDPDQPRDWRGRWTDVAAGAAAVVKGAAEVGGTANAPAKTRPGWPSDIKPIPLRPEDHGQRTLPLLDALKLMGYGENEAKALIDGGKFKEGCKGMYNFLIEPSNLQYGYKTEAEAKQVLVPPDYPNMKPETFQRMEGIIQAPPPANLPLHGEDTWIHPNDWWGGANGNDNFALKQPDGSLICMDAGGQDGNVVVLRPLPDKPGCSNLYVVIFRHINPPPTRPTE